MQSNSVQAIVLAAGKSKRFNTNRTKLVEKICGQEMILYPCSVLHDLQIPMTLIVGHQAEEVKQAVNEKFPHYGNFVTQEEQLGTGHAVACSQSTWSAETILILNGDMPLLTKETIQNLIAQHSESQAAITFAIAHHEDPFSTPYGIVVHEDDRTRIVESKDAQELELESCCVNAGIYLIKRTFLEHALKELRNNNKASEFYITDLVEKACWAGYRVDTYSMPFDEMRGVNTLQELWTAEHIKKSELISSWMEQGVRFMAPTTNHIDIHCSIGRDTIVGAGVHLLGKTVISSNCTIEPYSIIKDSTVSDNAIVKSHSVITKSTILNHVQAGPFAHISESTVKAHSCIGNFVELKRSVVGASSKAKHLTYIGDAHVGTHVNIGAGTVFCNYDGKKKHLTTVEDNCFIGSNNTLIAPLTISNGAYTAAGSVINKNVPSFALAIGRALQVNKENYAQKLHKEKSASFIAALKSDSETETNSTPK